ncbi:tetratricopeptide repeat protein [Kamptonema cortianum]|nr:tetratricopeptide repeat protein [Oscillatoria laete-virens]MDK3161875.1 tetratricopeptide repeat protein [Kamptonema cortianum]MDL5050553.1 tetratricopeptide repeat protein [Oscillatoria amoena NRMC-F 0135]MDL5055568.1 tetratricopeptide repeat protein [Oscillatoria laete-virens NRMC-F 0139]
MESVWKRFFINLAVCLLFAVPLFILGVKIALKGGYGDVIVGVGMMVLVGLILSLPFSDLFAHPIKGLFFPSAQYSKPILSYARADLYLKEGRFAEALEEFSWILKHYPWDTRAVIGKLCLLAQFAHRDSAAERLYAAAVKKITEDEPHRCLVEAYAMILARKDRILRKPSDLVYVSIYNPDDVMPAFHRV